MDVAVVITVGLFVLSSLCIHKASSITVSFSTLPSPSFFINFAVLGLNPEPCVCQHTLCY